jgi:flagellar hook assembly protein FlgD
MVKVKLDIFNIKGQKVKTLINKRMNAGFHQVTWNGKNDNDKPISSGIYFYSLINDGKIIKTKKMLMLK